MARAKGIHMEIGRLEFYATKPDRRGKLYGKIYPYNQTLRNSIDGGLVFFHESCVPRESALRTDPKLQGYRYKVRQRGKTVYADLVYVAFDMARKQTSRRGDAATAVMLLEEASPDDLPDLASVDGAGVRVALIAAFPNVYNLSRIGMGIVESDQVAQVAQLKACWDGSGDDERIAFVRSLDSTALERALIHLIGIDKRESPSLASPHRTQLALAARPDAALIPGVAEKLTPGMWVDELLTIMGKPDERKALMLSTQPPFRAYALTKYAEGGGSLEGDVADEFVAAVRGSVGAGIATECLKAALAAQPRLALRGDVAELLTPELWIEELLEPMQNPTERSDLLAHTRPEFRACAIARLAETGVPLDGEAAHDFADAVRECVDGELRAKCLRRALSSQPRLALIDDVAAMLTPDIWVDGLMSVMVRPEDRHAFLAATRPEFHAYAVSRLVETGGLLDGEDEEGFASALRGCGDKNLANESLRLVLREQPRLALGDDIAAMLTPNTWVDEFLEAMECPEDRHAFLSQSKPSFHVYAATKFVEAGGRLDDADISSLVTALHESGDTSMVTRCLAVILARQPRIALVGDVASMLTPGMWVDGLLGLMDSQADTRFLLAHAKPAFRAYAIARFVEAGARLSEADTLGFTAAVRECGDSNLATECLAVVLARQPQIALIGEVAPMLTPDMWVDELLGLMENPQGQMALLAPSSPDFRSHAVKKLIEAGIDLDIGILPLCPLRSYTTLLNQVQWSIDDASYAEAVGRWLKEACLCDGEGRKLVTSAAERMHETGDLLSPTMWAHLPATMRIRLCIFWSNHYADLDGYVVRGGIKRMCVEAYKGSWQGYDQVTKASLLMLALPFSKNPEKAFLDANDALIGEIIRQFNGCDAGALRSFALSDELQALLQRCSSYQFVDNRTVRGFCDGRWWEGASSVWCHRGMDRPDGGRRKCERLLFPEDANGIKDAERPVSEDQFMATLLANACDAMGGNVNVGPWLDSRSRMDLVDYTYRVSGYVNKMAAALPHMVCRGCGARLRLNYEYPRKGLYARSLSLPALSATVCSCPNAGDGHVHDEDVYIHYCRKCHRTIDSRECRLRDRDGYYLCMYCGASNVFDPATVCPCCGNTDQRTLGYYTGSLRDELSGMTAKPRSGEVLVVCKARGCGYDAREFKSEFE